MLEKLKDIFDNFIWYVWYKPKDIYRSIRHWCYTCGKYKEHWKFASHAMFHNYPWDFDYFLEIQYEWIKKSQAYFKNRPYCSEEKSDEINRYQKICLGLLEIMLDKREYWEYDSENHKSIMKIPVNLKNKQRFPYRGIDLNGNTYMSTDIYDRNPEEYYKYKAKYLYFKIIRDYADNWWD